MKKLLFVLMLASFPSLADGPCQLFDWGTRYYVGVRKGCAVDVSLVTCGGLFGNSVVSSVYQFTHIARRARTPKISTLHESLGVFVEFFG